MLGWLTPGIVPVAPILLRVFLIGPFGPPDIGGARSVSRNTLGSVLPEGPDMEVTCPCCCIELESVGNLLAGSGFIEPGIL